MENLLKELASTNSRNEKCAILETYKGKKKILRALQMTYDPFMMFHIKKFDAGSVGKRTFDSAFSDFELLARDLNDGKLTGNNAKTAVTAFMSTCNKDAQDVFTRILLKDLKVNVTDSTLNKVFGEKFIYTFEVQLAKTYDPEKKYKGVTHWWASRKYDGLRCYFLNGKLLTRNGHEIKGFDHIIAELKSINATFIDGELFTNEFHFQDVQGAVMSNKNIDPERKKKIRYNIFVVGGDWKNTTEMVDELNSINFKNFDYLKKVEYVLVENNPDAIMKLCKQFMEEGFEGVMLRDMNMWYDYKRSVALLKFKLFKESDFKCVGMEIGSGNFSGTLGAISIKGKVGKLNIVSNVGSGFSIEDRAELWKNKKNYIGKTVEIKYQGITDEPGEDGTFSLRFPVFLKWKFDR